MIRRISIGQFQLKQVDDGDPHLYLQGKPLHPIRDRAKKLRAAERKHASEVAQWITTFSPNHTKVQAGLVNYSIVERNLLTIYGELLHLNTLTAYINEQLRQNPEVAKYTYTSVLYTGGKGNSESTFLLRYFDKLPPIRRIIWGQGITGAVLIFNRGVLKYIDLADAQDMESLYQNYILVVKC